MTPDAHQRALVLRAQSGDREAFDSLLCEIGPPLVILGLVALGAHMNRNTLRVLARLDDMR